MGKLIVGDTMITFSRMKDIREDHDLTQKQMSDILAVKRSTYSLWELGINIIPIKYLSDYSDYFKLSMDYVLSISNIRTNKKMVNGFSLDNLGENLKMIRLSHNLTQDNIAQLLGVKQPCINKYEKGLACISLDNLYKFSKEFNVTIDELCGKIKK